LKKGDMNPLDAFMIGEVKQWNAGNYKMIVERVVQEREEVDGKMVYGAVIAELFVKSNNFLRKDYMVYFELCPNTGLETEVEAPEKGSYEVVLNKQGADKYYSDHDFDECRLWASQIYSRKAKETDVEKRAAIYTDYAHKCGNKVEKDLQQHFKEYLYDEAAKLRETSDKKMSFWQAYHKVKADHLVELKAELKAKNAA
jgi:hypothetical protein